jgi:uncharacterized protein
MVRASAKSGSIPPSAVSGLVQDRGTPGSAQEAPFRIASDGTWFYLGSAIQRPEMVRLFVRALKREPSGPSPTGYALVTPYERHAVIVEDAPFVATSVRVEGSGRSQCLMFTTNIGVEVTAGGDHAIVVRAAGAESGGPRPYLILDGGLEARIARSAYYELADRVEPGPSGDGALGVWSDGAFFPLEEPSP